jgi:hypothetical protein
MECASLLAPLQRSLQNKGGSKETVSKPVNGAGFQPFISCCNYFLGLCPRLIWLAPLALKLALKQ